MFPLALPASAARFLHSPTHRDLLLLYRQARIRPVEMTNLVSGTFEKPAYGLFASVNHLEAAMPSPVEKGDREAVYISLHLIYRPRRGRIKEGEPLAV